MAEVATSTLCRFTTYGTAECGSESESESESQAKSLERQTRWPLTCDKFTRSRHLLFFEHPQFPTATTKTRKDLEQQLGLNVPYSTSLAAMTELAAKGLTYVPGISKKQYQCLTLF